VDEKIGNTGACSLILKEFSKQVVTHSQTLFLLSAEFRYNRELLGLVELQIPD